jgi:hypothetical protein
MQTTPQGGGSQGVKSAAEDSSFYLLIVNPLANKCKTGIPFLFPQPMSGRDIFFFSLSFTRIEAKE